MKFWYKNIFFKKIITYEIFTIMNDDKIITYRKINNVNKNVFWEIVKLKKNNNIWKIIIRKNNDAWEKI